jgi:hypothetical protein
MSRTPYEITVRDPEMMGANPDEHEVVFTRHLDAKQSMSNVVALSDDELMDLFHAIGKRLDIDWHA